MQHWEKRVEQTWKRSHDLITLMSGGDPAKHQVYEGMEVMEFWKHVWSWDDLNRKKLKRGVDPQLEQ